MKRHICWLLPALLLLAACAAGGSESTEVPFPTATPVPTPAYLPENATTGAHIRARGYLLVGIRYDLPPFGYITDDGVPAGFGVEMGRELARRWLGNAQAVQFHQVRTDTAVEHLLAGDVDVVITALPHTQDAEAGADFALTYFIDGQALLVRAADEGAINGPNDLADRPVGVTAWSGADNALRAAVAFTPTIQTYDRFDEAVDALGWGGVDAVADLRHRLFWGKTMLPDTAVVGQYTALPMAIAYPQNDPFFADLVNLTFQEMAADGTYGELYRDWFSPEFPPVVERWPGDELPSLVDTPLSTSVPDTIAAIQARDRLVVGLAERIPFAYYDETGAPVGYEAGLVRQMAGFWLGDTTAVDFVAVSEETGREMLRTGQVDMLIGGLTHTRASELQIDFGVTTYMAGEGLMVQAGTVITDVTSLNGQRVAVVEGGESGEVLLEEAQIMSVSVTIVPRPSMESALALLSEGQVIAIAGDRADLLGPATITPGLGVLPLRLTQVPLALGLPPGDSAFRDLVNMTLLQMRAEGQFVTLYATWFDDTPIALEAWPGAPYRPLSLR